VRTLVRGQPHPLPPGRSASARDTESLPNHPRSCNLAPQSDDRVDGMPVDDEWETVQRVIARCADEADLDEAVLRYGKILSYLVCQLARSNGMSDRAVHFLYSQFADITLDELRSPGRQPRRH